MVFELRKVDFETILHVPVGFLRDSGVASIVLLLLTLRHLLAFSSAMLDATRCGDS